jgi:hypothetical protein
VEEADMRRFEYRVIRYMPNLERDEWVNIGVMLQEAGDSAAPTAPRRDARMLEEDGDFARLRRLQPEVDVELLRNFSPGFAAVVREQGGGGAEAFLRGIDDAFSNRLQMGPAKSVLAAEFEGELERLYQAQVVPVRGVRGGLLENTRAWIRARLSDVFRRRGILAKMQRSVRVEEFTEPGDPLRIDYSYRANGTRGFLHAISLARDPAQAKVLAYTAECIRARVPKTEFAAVVEMEPAAENPRHQFVARLFEGQQIAMVPLNRIERFAEELRVRVN